LHGALAQEISGIVLHVTLAQEIPVPSVYPLASSRIPILTMENITTINAADLAKLRDQLNLKLGAYNEAVKNNKIAANEIKNTLQQINEDHLKVLHEFDINTDELFNIDIEALTTNEEYLKNKLQTLSSAYQKIDESVRKQLGL